MQSGMIYLKTWGGIQILLHSRHLDFAFVCFWWNTHGTEFSYIT